MFHSQVPRAASAPALRAAGFGLWVALAGCGASNLPNADPFHDPPPAPREASRDPDVIGLEEIERREGRDMTAHQVIRQLRPQWLQPRGRPSLVDPESG